MRTRRGTRNHLVSLGFCEGAPEKKRKKVKQRNSSSTLRLSSSRAQLVKAFKVSRTSFLASLDRDNYESAPFVSLSHRPCAAESIVPPRLPPTPDHFSHELAERTVVGDKLVFFF